MRRGVYGEVKRGVVRKTENQEKKHVRQMSRKELMYLVERIDKNKDKFTFSYHLAGKVERGAVNFTHEQVKEIMMAEMELAKSYKSQVIEYNQVDFVNFVDKRVLLRSKVPHMVKVENERGFVHEKECVLCIVFSIVTGEIVTAYWNETRDAHKTINWTRYNSKLCIA